MKREIHHSDCIEMTEGLYLLFPQVFLVEPNSEATRVEINFLHSVSNGYWDFPKNEDVKIAESTSKMGWRFGEEDKKAMNFYKLIKNSCWKAYLQPGKSYLWVISSNKWNTFQNFWWFSFIPTFCSCDIIIIKFYEILSLLQFFILPTFKSQVCSHGLVFVIVLVTCISVLYVVRANSSCLLFSPNQKWNTLYCENFAPSII